MGRCCCSRSNAARVTSPILRGRLLLWRSGQVVSPYAPSAEYLIAMGAMVIKTISLWETAFQMHNGPTLNIRSMAQMLHAPLEKKVRVLREQKYPKQVPQVFRTPYYSAALTGIRSFYRAGNETSALATARSKAESITNDARREHNKRILDSFASDAVQYGRKLLVQSNTRLAIVLSNVELRLSADLKALEGKAPRYIYYNLKATALPARLAEDALNLGHWVLEQNGIIVPIQALEFVDLFIGKVHKVRSRSAATEKALRENARVIEELWPTL